MRPYMIQFSFRPGLWILLSFRNVQRTLHKFPSLSLLLHMISIYNTIKCNRKFWVNSSDCLYFGKFGQGTYNSYWKKLCCEKWTLIAQETDELCKINGTWCTAWAGTQQMVQVFWCCGWSIRIALVAEARKAVSEEDEVAATGQKASMRG
jgi:hypothetical protein